jgi:capsule biosynthesis phosphatase
MSYPHSIVVDIDDCVSFTINRDFENARANEALIQKLNELYDLGWDVYYITARGSLSCTTREEAKLKYYSQIEEWLKKHNCKYTELSFDKKLASYYIDDKAYKPEEFLNLTFEQFKGGLSGAVTELRDNKVYKTAENTAQTVKWYSVAKTFFKVPKIYSVIGKTICMEYLNEDDDGFNVFDVIDKVINREKTIPSISNASFDSYIERCKVHLENIVDIASEDKDGILSLFKTHAKEFESKRSFSHGDLTVDNILFVCGNVYLIDPNFDDNLFSSYILDIGKLLHSFNRYDRRLEYDTLLNNYSQMKTLCLLSELSHWIRIYKYADKQLKGKTVERIIELYGLLR